MYVVYTMFRYCVMWSLEKLLLQLLQCLILDVCCLLAQRLVHCAPWSFLWPFRESGRNTKDMVLPLSRSEYNFQDIVQSISHSYCYFRFDQIHGSSLTLKTHIQMVSNYYYLCEYIYRALFIRIDTGIH